ncbi:unnamed protein product [Oncorhynchus mykiss]|uniref:Uncharacterized protein n=1 Tax=Oncorhynchus mykiss TaxID=8022 RepID=A0A060YS57_ONCMY|nr:unnamed protein product [Oncorhynchus mykiss]
MTEYNVDMICNGLITLGSSSLLLQLSSDFASPPPSPTWTNPFAHVRLRKTVTNDRSAPIIE